MRYFLAEETAYESSRHFLNAAWNLPAPGTETALVPSAECVKAEDGRVLFMVDRWMCDLEPAPGLIEAAVFAGDLIEITESEAVGICLQAKAEA
jgi:hypothetical protein